MKIIQQEKFIELIADEGKTLNKDDIYSYDVILGYLDSPDNWMEVDDENI